MRLLVNPLVARIPKNDRIEEIGWEKPVGREVW